MKKKRPIDRKSLNPFHTAEAAKAFDSLYQRYLDTVYQRVVASLTHSSDANHTALKQFVAAFDDLNSRSKR